ncbi:MAG TPA: LD-carboxypeptidase [Candidatus Acidoferrum sp.]|nr:LD-carboxypeptidase [Candidatus Acidoferrum sp.]
MRSGDTVRLVSLASPIKEHLLEQGCEEIIRLGLQPQLNERAVLARTSFFAGSPRSRLESLFRGLDEQHSRALFCTRGGYGSTYLLEGLASSVLPTAPKILLGCSDITSVQIFLWEKYGWVTFYGPMVATNFCRGAGVPHGYDRESLLAALNETASGWTINLQGESLIPGDAIGVVLGGCLTLIETSLGTPWELKTDGAILVLEDRGMKPYAVDRALTHLRQAGKFRNITGVILGDYPEGEVSVGEETVRDVARRIFGPLDIPVVWGAPIGHTSRPMLTLPLGVRGRLVSDELSGATRLEILEPACRE